MGANDVRRYPRRHLCAARDGVAPPGSLKGRATAATAAAAADDDDDDDDDGATDRIRMAFCA